MKFDIDSEEMSGFVNNLERINAIADKAEGFIWRLTGEEDNATAIQVFEDNYLIINMSVWKDIESLFNYVYHSGHLEVYKRKKEWFHHMEDMHMAFWHIEEGHIPTPQEAKDRLEYINKHGESEYAFTFKSMRKKN